MVENYDEKTGRLLDQILCQMATLELRGLPDAEARKRFKHTNANRAPYIKQVHGHDWRERAL